MLENLKFQLSLFFRVIFRKFHFANSGLSFFIVFSLEVLPLWHVAYDFHRLRVGLTHISVVLVSFLLPHLVELLFFLLSFPEFFPLELIGSLVV